MSGIFALYGDNSAVFDNDVTHTAIVYPYYSTLPDMVQ